MAILKGEFAPSRQVGAAGDFFVDTRAWVLYGPKTKAAGWPEGKPIWPDGTPRPLPDIRNDVPLATKRGESLETRSGAGLFGDPPAR